MQKICKVCRWWTVFKDGYLLKNYPHFGNCSNQIYWESQGDVPKDVKFIYWDYEGYSAGFYTHETFGCIGWEERE